MPTQRCFLKDFLSLWERTEIMRSSRLKTTPLWGKKKKKKRERKHLSILKEEEWGDETSFRPSTLGLLLKLWELFSLSAIKAQVVIDSHKLSRLRSFSFLPLVSLDVIDVCFYMFYKLCPSVLWHFDDSPLSQCNIWRSGQSGPGCQFLHDCWSFFIPFMLIQYIEIL